ncbi:MAG: MFS transporter [Gammaproteobacteria bacterium]|nr:MFS transporter [Gammaproteobacteria bacterium]
MSKHSAFELLKTRRFLPFFGTQFLGAFNDNVHKQAIIILLASGILSLGEVKSDILINACQLLFILPYFLFSATAGQIADKYEKSKLIRITVAMEIAAMSLGAVGFLTSNLPILLASLFIGGTQSALFGPVKYSIIPAHLRETELVGGNGLVEMGTFVAILVGSIFGGLIIVREGGALVSSALTIVVACLGLACAFFIPRAEAAAPHLKINWNIFSETWKNLGYTRRKRVVFLSVLGNSWFWFYGAAFTTQVPNFTTQYLGGDASVIPVVLTIFSLGIGTGSLLCERLSGHKVEIGLVPFGSIGMSIFALDLYLHIGAPFAGTPSAAWEFLKDASHYRTLSDLFLIGVFGGFFIVPLYALIQSRSDPEYRSRVIAGNNILNSLAVVLSSILGAVLLGMLGWSIPQFFLLAAVLNACVALYIYTLVPEFLMRFLVWMLIHTLYRVRHENLQQIPEEGPAVLVCNHVSFVDALVIAGCCRRPVRFVMYHKIFKIPVLSFIFKTAKAIPIAPAKEDAEMKTRAFYQVQEALGEGELVCIFPEGQISYDGQLAPFKPGVEEIISRTPVPVIPMALQGLWGSFFSRRHGAAMQKLPTRFWSRIGIVAGAPIPPEQVTAAVLQEKVAALRGDWL